MGEAADEPEDAYPTEVDVDAVLAEFGGDPRAALRALLADLGALAQGWGASVSKGYVRGKIPKVVRRPRP